MSRAIHVIPLAGLVAASMALVGFARQAVAFDVKQLEVEKGALDLGSENTFNRGIPHALGAGVTRSEHELALDYGARSWWKTTLALTLEKPEEEQFRASSVSWQNILVFKPVDDQRPVDVGFGMFAMLDVSIHNDTTDTAIAGPIATLKLDKVSITGNAFFERTFGRNSDDALALSYGWHVKYPLRDGFAVGVEGFGAIDDLGHAGSYEDQEHRIGPTIFTELKLSNDLTISPDLGLQFGLTRATPDVALKLNIGIPLYAPPKKNGD